jgi:signal transduction histidine kinase
LKRASTPALVAALGLLGAVLAAAWLHRAATEAMDSLLEARLVSAGEAAAALLPPGDAAPALATLLRVNALDGASLVSPGLVVLADARGPAGARADLLRVDPALVASGAEGRSTVAWGYTMGNVPVLTGYFPVHDDAGGIRGVLVLEAGERFAASRISLGRALASALVLAALAAAAVALLVAMAQRTEAARAGALVEAARGEALSRLAAISAHEIRNPLSVIQATVELLRERVGQALDPRAHAALEDVLTEVRRLRRLTDDLLDLAASRPLALSNISLSELLQEAGRAVEATTPETRVHLECPLLPPLRGDGARLRQVFDNLLRNAAQACPGGEVRVQVSLDGGHACIRIEDDGPGVAVELRSSLFELFATTKSGGTGLGLAVSRRLVEAHGGTLRLVPSVKGAAFEVRLPRATEDEP